MSKRFSTLVKEGYKVSRKLGNARLLKLAEHLEKPKRYHEEFDFEVWSRGPRTNECGTAGCAIGECPAVFPRDWKFVPSPDSKDEWKPLLRGEIETSWGDRTMMAIQTYFGLSYSQTERLFIPGNRTYFYNDFEYAWELTTTKDRPVYTNGETTPKVVAANIRAFVEKYPG